MYSEIERTRKLGSGVDDFRLDDVVKDGVNTGCWDQSGPASDVLSGEVLGSDTLLKHTWFASALQDVLSGAK